MRFVRIQHKETGGSALVSERAALHYKDKGWELADEQPPPPAEDSGPERPQKNDSTKSWRDYAVMRGMTAEYADTQSRDELIAYFDRIDPQES